MASSTQMVIKTVPTTSQNIMKIARRAQEAPSLIGVVVSAGRMDKAVKVQTTKQRRDSYLKRLYVEHPSHLVSDPADSLRTGDVVRYTPWKTATGARRIAHVVTEIIKPFGPPIDARPPVPSLQELIDRRQAKWEAKQERRAARKADTDAKSRHEPGVLDAEREQREAQDVESDRTGAQLEGMNEEALESERQTEELEERAKKQNVDLDGRIEQMQRS